jgi:CheY-like chemotaxis protein
VVDAASELFKVMGYDVLSATCGEEALEVLRRTPDIEVLFSDIMMRGMNGVELGRAARSLRAGINVILVTGHPAESLNCSPADLRDLSPAAD